MTDKQRNFVANIDDYNLSKRRNNMITIGLKKLAKILELHKKWLNGAKDGVCADLNGANLQCANLDGANLDGAKLQCADLGGANLRGADLRDTDLNGANLQCANLDGAKLQCADLGGANLRGADLRDTDLNGANLQCANLDGANLQCADLGGANLRGADLRDTDLNGADLGGANLRGAKLNGAKLQCADLGGANLNGAKLNGAKLNGANLNGANLDGAENCRLGVILDMPIIGYKKASNHIVKLSIPKGAIVFSINNDKCRTNKAEVLEISDGLKEIKSDYDDRFIYEVGKNCEVKDFDLEYNIECGKGIHFFKTKKEAEKYH